MSLKPEDKKKTRAKNLCGKTRDVEHPYEIWEADGWEWRVLKKYQTPEKEQENPYARWFLATKSPYTYGDFELGDGYVKDVTDYAVCTFKEELEKPEEPENILPDMTIGGVLRFKQIKLQD
jgi:hypothetical protein